MPLLRELKLATDMKGLTLITFILLFSCCKNQENEVYAVITTMVELIPSGQNINIVDKTTQIWEENLGIDICSLKNLSLLQSQARHNQKDQEISKILSQRDIEYMCRQNDVVLVLDSTYLPENVRLFSKKHLLEKKLDYSSPAIYQISTPMFDSKQRYALVYFDKYCGPECGGGGLYILEKKDGKWGKIAYIMLWVS
jgi:hypothetical protein